MWRKIRETKRRRKAEEGSEGECRKIKTRKKR
jgi:hypothetical protein